MKTYVFTLLLIVVAIVSYNLGYQKNQEERIKHYEAACLQADFIRSLMDWDFNETGPSIGSEIEESWYEWYQDLPLGNYKTQYIKDIRDFEEYYWAY